MKSLHSKISKPILKIVIIVPIVVFILFNLSARFYINRQTEAELKNVVSNVKLFSITIIRNFRSERVKYR